ncbi:U-box domain-containing protein [Vigna angularis]|uniref:U-box domain-containing protein n=1 Tax=Phaseolus angularis TaxID=3914 RepID=A0A8T0KZR1_PHAAN|nr:U-box domain-containing protein [Vigna angularis]
MDDKDKSEKRSRDRHSERHRDSDDHRPRDSDDHRHHRSDKHHKRDPKSRDRDKDRAYEREGSKDRDRDRNSVQERESRSKVKRDEEREDLVELGHSSQSHKRKERELSKERNFEDKKLRLPLRGGNEGNLGIKVKNEEQEEKVVSDHKKIFWDVCVKAPGGTDDATHFRDSLLYRPLLPFLLILFSPSGMGTPAQNLFDGMLMKGRSWMHWCSEGLEEIRNSRALVPLLIDLLRFGSVKGKENSITLLLGLCKEEGEVVARRL